MKELIVVGVDGSKTSQMATRWAAHEARLRGADLELVAAWEIPMYDFGFGPTGSTSEVIQGATKVAQDHLDAAKEAAEADGDAIQVQTKAVEGQAARVLMDESKDADLLVVGSRGLGGFRELLLGSVSQQCADHAGCPVVIVRHTHQDA